MKHRIWLLAFLLPICMGNALCQNVHDLWNSTFVSAVQNAPCIGFSMTVDGIYTGEAFDRDTVCHVMVTKDALWQIDGFDRLEYLWLTRDTFCFINQRADDIVYGSVWKDSTHTTYESAYSTLIRHGKVAWADIARIMPLYFWPWEYSPSTHEPSEVYDTILDGVPYWVFVGEAHIYGEMDGDKFVPNDDTVLYFVGKSSHLVERMDIIRYNRLTPDTGTTHIQCHFHNAKVLQNPPLKDGVWSTDSPLYANTPRFNIRDSFPASLATLLPPTRYSMEDSILLNYPLVDIHGDSVSLAQMKGWLLIDLFQYGCHPCAMFHKTLQEESADDGRCILEKNGVRVVCILPKTGLSDAFKRYVCKFELQKRAYCARELAPLVDGLNYYPRYFLMSPDRKVVLEDVHDTKQILQAIREYEKTN